MRMAQEGFEPSASLVLSESGLPVAYRAKMAANSHKNLQKPLHTAIDPFPGAGIEPATSTFRAWRHYQQQLPRSQRIREFGKEDSNLHRLIQSQGACRLADSRVVIGRWSLVNGRWALASRPALLRPGSKRDRGFEPRLPGWKPGVVPL